MSHFGGDEEDGRGDTHRVHEAYHGEEDTAEGRQDVGDSQGVISAGSSANPVVNGLHHNKTGDGGRMGGTADNFRHVCKGDGL